jgi:hypothetical protein
MDDPSVSEELLKDFELVARPNHVVYKIFHVDGDENRNRNFQNLDRLFGKYFNRLSAKTEYLSSIEETRTYLASNLDLRVLDNHDYEGWKPGAIGIWASWKNAFNAFTKSDSSALILIEDDLWATEEFVSRRILSAVQELPSGWDYLALFTPEPQRSDFSSHHELGLEYSSLPYHTWSAAAVMVSQSGASKLLRHMSEGISQNCDLHLFINKESGLNGFALKPKAMLHGISVFSNYNSTIGSALEGKRYTRNDLYDVIE